MTDQEERDQEVAEWKAAGKPIFNGVCPLCGKAVEMMHETEKKMASGSCPDCGILFTFAAVKEDTAGKEERRARIAEMDALLDEDPETCEGCASGHPQRSREEEGDA